MNKKEARKIYTEKRKALGDRERSKLDDLLLIQFQTTAVPVIHTLFSYWPIEENNEPNTHLLTDYLEFRNPGIVIAYPKVDLFLDEMVAVSTDAETSFLKNEFNIYEPEEGNRIDAAEIDLVLVPLLAFDKKGYRVGYGKGYYDKFLAGCRKDCIKAGFSYFDPLDQITDKADFDVPLNLCITPQSVYVF
jgi:5-formyltetrahydrofolate cyclo-ligase